MTRTEELLSMATAFRINDDVTIEKRGDDAWCVVVGAGTCVNTALEREYEPLPSARDEEFRLRTRFSLEDAFSLAEAYETQRHRPSA